MVNGGSGDHDLDLSSDLASVAVTDELTAELDLSDPAINMNISGVAPLKTKEEEETMFITPRANSRVVRIISKQSNV
jgi:hypothetical protein